MMTTPIGQPTITAPGTRSSVQETLDQINTPSVLSGEGGLGSLGQADFLRLLTTQLANQDPLSPTDNDEMLAQLAQFSQLEAANDSTAVLNDISDKLDALTVAQEAAVSAAQSAAEAAERAAEAAEQAVTPELP
ncbi:MAG: flagellar biosynthesis protein FlgD [Erythrobacter sp.]|nr:flagellar biosynthesis protein FlgD [Erythrobacter sp.]